MTGDRQIGTAVGPCRMLQRSWRQETRLQPWTLIATTVALGVAWAASSRLDLAVERSMLVLLTTVALSLVFTDDAAIMTAASPTPLVVRRAARAGIAVSILAASWAVILFVSLITVTEIEPMPWWAMTLEWCVVAGTQVALASTSRSQDALSRSIAPGAILALLWVSAIQAAPTHARLYPVADHAVTWAVILIVSVLCVAALSADPARRTDRRRVRHG